MRKRLLVLVGGLAATTLALSTVTASAHPAGTRGAPGIGDPYFPLDGNGGYDVAHYAIVDSYDIASDALSGHTTVKAKATQDLTRFDFDIVLTVDSVKVNGTAATFNAQPHELVITPAAEIPDGSTFTVQVAYHGTPHEISYGGEQPWIWDGREALSTNEPHIAPWWFAANDHPTDKATYDITVSVPKGNQVVSNGTLVSSKKTARKNTWHWRMTTPIASYLAFFAAGKYAIRTGTKHGLPYTIAASKDLTDPQAYLDRLASTSDIVAWEETQFGRYPFTSTGGLVTGTGPGASRSRTPAGRPTRQVPASRRWCTSWRTSGSATTSRCTTGATSG